MSNIDIKITADVVSLQSQFAVAKASSTALTAELNKLARTVNTTGMTEQLRADLLQTSEAMLTAKARTAALGDELHSHLAPAASVTSEAMASFSGTALLGTAAAFYAAAKGIEEFIGGFAELGEHALNTAAELGITTEQVSKFAYAAGEVGVDGDSASTMLERLERNMVEAQKGTGAAAGAFVALGITTEDLKNKYSSLAELLPILADRFSQTADGPNKTAIAIDLMGRSGAQMIPILDKGREGLDELGDAADRAGVVLTTGAAKSMATTHAELYSLTEALEGQGVQAFEALEPKIDLVVTGLSNQVEQFSRSAREAGVLHDALGLLGEALTVVIGATAEAGSLLEIAWDAGEGAIKAATAAVTTYGKVNLDVLSGDIPQAIADASAGWHTIQSDIDATDDRIKNASNDLSNFIFELQGISQVAVTPRQTEKPDLPTPADPSKPKAGNNDARRIADEQAEAYEQAAAKTIETEEQKDRFLEQMGQETLDTLHQQLVDAENKKYQLETQELARKEAADAGDKVAEAKDLAQSQVLHANHVAALQSIDEQYATKQKQINETNLQDFVKTENDKLTVGITSIEELYKNHLISAQTERDEEVQLTTAIEAQVLARFDAENSGLVAGTQAYAEAMKQRQAIVDGFTKHVAAADNTLATQQATKWKELGSSIEGSFNSALDGLILQGDTFKQFMGNLAQGVAGAFLHMGEQIVEGQIETFIASKTSSSASALSQILANAGVAASGAIAATAAIPYIGPELAPAAGAAAFAEAAGYASVLSAAGGDWRVTGGLYNLHENEMVIPAHIAQPMRDHFSGGGSSGGSSSGQSGDTYHISPQYSISTIDQRGVREWLNDPVVLRTHAQALARYLSNNPSVRPTY